MLFSPVFEGSYEQQHRLSVLGFLQEILHRPAVPLDTHTYTHAHIHILSYVWAHAGPSPPSTEHVTMHNPPDTLPYLCHSSLEPVYTTGTCMWRRADRAGRGAPSPPTSRTDRPNCPPSATEIHSAENNQRDLVC